ncbi:MAG: Gfo/Idh/MocA family oxidoreductase, partial [Acidobacteriota bacterium]
GGGLYDIGCYMIQGARFAFGREPERVAALLDRDPALRTDRVASAMLDFGGPQATFTVSTQLIPYQRMNFFGTRGRIELEIPVNVPNDRPTRLFIDSSGDLGGGGITAETLPTHDQYTVQGDAFAQAVEENTEVPVPIEDSICNMAVIDAIFRSAASGQWEKPQP